MVEIIYTQNSEAFEQAAILFRRYAEWLGIDLCFQGFEKELTILPDMYKDSDGGIWLAKTNQQWVGCIGLRRIDPTTAELKRMYVLPEFQGMGIGKQLLDAALSKAALLKYSAIRLDTLQRMKPAIAMYQKAGFIEIPAYYPNPEPEVLYFEKQLRPF